MRWDFTTVLGILAGVVVLLLALLAGGNLAGYIDVPSFLLVVTGSPFIVLARFRMRDSIQAMKDLKRIVQTVVPDPFQLIADIASMAEQARKGGLLALESAAVSDLFLQRGVDFIVDGHDAESVRQLLQKELMTRHSRHFRSVQVFRSWGDVAPAVGMIGTLVGLVAMLANLDDPSAIGPGMAIALLTTLYGALIAQFIALPIADKLEQVVQQEKRLRYMMIDGLQGIQNGVNPRLLTTQLQSYMEDQHG
ncbi:MotA/TolQ/ExbB proton channel family protein [Permianibacter aggregans]|uniref:Chemotaxis protein MotA n=1 Tax=Permianibacter aggregans TaxID=1510150 RepID=A0A4V3D7H2_9GAMM|nr:MotA/TolQ/ExbB proton channel family protein [Permianibacter aggregans]QGX39095.1 flagellar motor protein PomA [Permianibacter aggregans]TDQ47697.1 chemotaxis protein MotA [Permianibacter aggregans]